MQAPVFSASFVRVGATSDFVIRSVLSLSLCFYYFARHVMRRSHRTLRTRDIVHRLLAGLARRAALGGLACAALLGVLGRTGRAVAGWPRRVVEGGAMPCEHAWAPACIARAGLLGSRAPAACLRALACACACACLRAFMRARVCVRLLSPKRPCFPPLLLLPFCFAATSRAGCISTQLNRRARLKPPGMVRRA